MWLKLPIGIIFFNRRARAQVWRHKDQVYFYESPVTKDFWYTVFEDVKGWKRLAIHEIGQDHNDAAPGVKNIQVRWTLDGNSWVNAINLDKATEAWIHRHHGGISIKLEEFLALKYTVLMAENIKLEMRITSALGNGQDLESYVVYEELERVR